MSVEAEVAVVEGPKPKRRKVKGGAESPETRGRAKPKLSVDGVLASRGIDFLVSGTGVVFLLFLLQAPSRDLEHALRQLVDDKRVMRQLLFALFTCCLQLLRVAVSHSVLSIC